MRLIDENNEQVGIVTRFEAQDRADKLNLDLVEVAGNSSPPVCKIINYGKYRYEQKKKATEAKKNQKVISIKEVKFRLNTDVNDFDIKMKNVIKFLMQENKVKISIRFRGREIMYQENGREILNKIAELSKEYGVPESKPNLDGRQFIMMLTPNASK